ncbi:UPF0587 protein v1g245604 [Ischnura elegans]|uniref:UPF0587 protein v1g245604 n=1 Tax=Ischnura elegans TaxID=197161 RepID=UPI001ED8B591|nr:UPF0587 protein v1g245604 [Ischnura elegans]
MPIFELQLKASLENTAKIQTSKGMFWKIRFACSSCHEMSAQYMEFNADEETDVGRGKANLASKCHFCGRVRSVLVMPKSEQAYVASEPPAFSTIIKFDCRGMEPVEYAPGEGWVVEAESGEVYLDVDLTECEWVDYDSRNQCPVGIYCLESQFQKE